MDSTTAGNEGLLNGLAGGVLYGVLGLVTVALLFFFLQRGWRSIRGAQEFEIDEAELGVGNQKLKLRANREDLRVAYQLWVELSTRKIGLPLDFDDDVIAEVYDSWYQFFGITRELIKDIPPSKLRGGESIQGLIQLAIDVLNQGMRPHLTRWQARFRRWYDSESSKSENILIEPQELQKRFPRYEELKEDMERVNARLMYYREQMRQFVFGESAKVIK